MQTSARLLAVLGLLQSRPLWPGAELAARLEVSTRTLRKDVDRLRALDYPIDAVPGPHGGYRLGQQGKMPPLLLADDEAVAVAIGLGAVRTVPGISDASTVALAKLKQVMPDRLRRRVEAIDDTTDVGPVNTGTNVEDPSVAPALLAELGAAIRAREGIRFFYGPEPDAVEAVEADPYRLVSWQQRWYLVARRRPDLEWHPFRVDWMTLRSPGASRFHADPLQGHYADFVLRHVAYSGWAVHARILVDAPADEVLARINPTVGVVETVDDTHSVLVTGGDSLEVVAVWIGMLGLDFHVDAPAQLVDHLRELANRYQRALP
jgi:predicted DNA-binding transcriptional regulator YafY